MTNQPLKDKILGNQLANPWMTKREWNDIYASMDEYAAERAKPLVEVLRRCKNWIEGDRLHHNVDIQMGCARLMDEITQALTAFRGEK